jgi:hypothetical protein
MYAESFRECFCFQGVKVAIRSQTLAKSRPIPSAWQTVINLIPITMKSAPSQCTNIVPLGILLLKVLNLYYILLKVILPVSPPRLFLIWFRTRIIGNTIQEKIRITLKSGNACYHSVQNLLSSSLLSKKLKIKKDRTIILPVVMYGCETWSLILRE